MGCSRQLSFSGLNHASAPALMGATSGLLVISGRERVQVGQICGLATFRPSGLLPIRGRKSVGSHGGSTGFAILAINCLDAHAFWWIGSSGHTLVLVLPGLGKSLCKSPRTHQSSPTPGFLGVDGVAKVNATPSPPLTTILNSGKAKECR